MKNLDPLQLLIIMLHTYL